MDCRVLGIGKGDSTRAYSMRYVKKPIVVEARKLTRENWESVKLWCGGRAISIFGQEVHIAIDTLEGVMKASVGDYIIKEPHPIRGRSFYPCRPEVFDMMFMSGLKFQ